VDLPAAILPQKNVNFAEAVMGLCATSLWRRAETGDKDFAEELSITGKVPISLNPHPRRHKGAAPDAAPA
jgi:hypothetical protein